MVALNSTSVISQSTQQDKFLKLKAFTVSLSLHLLLFGSMVQLAREHFTTPAQEVKKEEKRTQISLSAYKVFTPKPAKIKKEIVKPQPKKVVKKKKIIKKEIKKVKKIVKQEPKKIVKAKKIVKKKVKPIEEKTLQKTQQKQAVVASSEAFTPQIPHTEQVKVTKKELALQNSPLSDSKNSQLALIRSLIQNALKYPAIAKRLHLEGVVTVSFSLSTTGEVSNLQLIQSSNSSVLDKRALQTVSSLDGEFPHLDKKVDLKIPIAFSLQHS
ncbi:MAG: energy transducer TonB [Sulfurimonas sp.]